MLACKPTTISPVDCHTKWYGCPIGVGGRPSPIYGVVIHVVPDGHMDDVVAHIGDCDNPTSIPNDSRSYHYTIPDEGHIYNHVLPEDIAWAMGFYCNFAVYPNITPGVYPGWPLHPAGDHIAETSIHIGISQSPSPIAYEQLVRLLSYLHYQYNIPFDPGHMTQIASVVQSGVLSSPALFNVVQDAEAYCERCCDILEYDNVDTGFGYMVPSGM